MYRQTFEECVWDCIMKGGHRFECEDICRMNPSSANFHGYNPHSIPTTSAPMSSYGTPWAYGYNSYSQPTIYSSIFPIDPECYAQCMRNGHSTLFCQNACRENPW